MGVRRRQGDHGWLVTQLRAGHTSRIIQYYGRRIRNVLGDSTRGENELVESLLPNEETTMTNDTDTNRPTGCGQLRALLWKSWLTQRRKPLWTLAELSVPVILVATLAVIHSFIPKQRLPDTEYEPFFVHGDARDFVFEYVDGRPMLTGTFTPTELYYAPRTPVTEVIVRKLVDKLRLQPKWAPANPCSDYTADAVEEWKSTNVWKLPDMDITATGFDNGTELGQKLFDKLKSYSSTLYAGIIFDDDFASGKNTKNVTYTLRFPFEQRNIPPDLMQGSVVYSWATNQFGINDYQNIHERANASDGGIPGYWREGFATLQRALDTVLTETIVPGSLCLMAMMDVRLVRFPFIGYVSHPLLAQFPLIMPSIMVVSFVLSLLYIARSLTVEKENNLVEYIEIVTGLSLWIQWSAYFLINLFKMALICGLMTAALSTTVLSSSHPLLVFLFLFLFSFNVIAFAFFISAFFNGANNATLCAGVFWFLLYVPCLYAQRYYTELNRYDKMYFSLLAQGAAVIGCQIIGNLEQKGIGLNWETLRERSSSNSLAPYEVLLFMFLDALPLFILGLYINAVKSSRRSGCCVLLPCFGHCSSRRSSKTAVNNSSFDSQSVERASTDIRPSLLIENLVKKYRDHNGRRVVALDNFSFFVQPGELTVILGHNGAGKTTLMRVLTGCIKPSSGSVSINDADTSLDMDVIRRSLGYCPQYNTLFDCLTVEEHLRFYAKLKGANTDHSRHKEKVDKTTRLLRMLHLDKKKHTFAKNLSGGQKRRLSLAIALVGSPRVILMDEPTSGMDPGAKGDVIDVLKSVKQPEVTMVLVTHYVDEAELLGDRVAIVSEGRLRCYGTNMFLKNRFGNGYRLTVIFGRSEDGKRVRTSVAASRVQEAVDEICTGACRLLKTKGDEATFLLHGASNAVETCRRHRLVLYTLESLTEQLYIRSIVVSMPSMQDVFMNCCTEVGHKGKTIPLTSVDENDEDMHHLGLPLTTAHRNTGCALFRQQFIASFKKRILFSWRQKRLLFLQFLVLALCVGMGAVLNNFLRRHSPIMPPLELDPGAYGPGIVPLAISFLGENTTNKEALAIRIADRLIETFRNSIFVGSTVEEVPNGTNLAHWLLESSRSEPELFTRSRLFAVDVNQMTYVVNDTNVRVFLLDGYFNTRASHSAGAITNALGNVVLKHFCSDCRIRSVNHPLPQTTVLYYSFGDDFVTVMCLLVGMSFLCTSFAVSLVQERVNGAKHQQLLAGLRLVPYWIANCLWDVTIYIIACGLVCLIWWLSDSPLLDGSARFGYVCLILASYGLAVLPMTYALTFFLRTPASAMTVLTSINLLSGLAPTITVAMLVHASFNQPDLKDLEQTVSSVCVTVFPQFALARSLMAYYGNIIMKEQCQAMNMCDWLEQSSDAYFRVTDDPLEWGLPGVGRLLLSLILQSVALFCLLFLIEWFSLRPSGWWRHRNKADSPEVATFDMKQYKGQNGIGKKRTMLEVTNLTIQYHTGSKNGMDAKLPAVQGLTFDVFKGEIFGLNGENASGKTSTYKVLTGLLAPYEGRVIVNGKYIRNSWREAAQDIGYCPQFDALLERLTGSELLTHFARLRGLEEHELVVIVNGLLDALGLANQANRLVKSYSGGNRRKVSLAIALIGAPSLLLLDEPTCGVDPKSRRAIWKLLKYMKHRLGASIVLTSHDMEECEWLCDRMGVLVKGRLACVDRPAVIAETYGCHYLLRITVENSCDLDDLEEAIFTALPDAQLKAKPNSCQVHFTIPKAQDVTWSRLYRIVERLASQWPLSDFAISRASLQEAFVTVARGEATLVQENADYNQS